MRTGVAVTVLAAAGCASKTDNAPKPPTVSAAAAAAAPDEVPAHLRFLTPADGLIVSVDLRQVRDTAVWRSLRENLDAIGAPLPGCDGALFDTIDSVTIGVDARKLRERPSPVRMRVTGSFGHAEIETCVGSVAAVFKARALPTRNGLRIARPDGDHISTVTWMPDGFIVRPSSVEDTTGPAHDQRALIDRIEPRSMAWVAIRSQTSDPSRPSQLWARVQGGDGLLVEGGGTFSSERDARDWADAFVARFAAAAAARGTFSADDLIERAEVTTTDGILHMRLRLPTPVLVEFFGAAE